MLLTIHNLPPTIRYSDVKNLLQAKCGLSDLILDNMLPEGNTKRVTVGVSNEGDAAILVRKINGLYLEGRALYVEDVRKKRETEQPFRLSSMPEKVPQQEQVEQIYPKQSGEQHGYPAMDQSLVLQAQYMMPQPITMDNYSMMGNYMAQMQDPNYVAYQNQTFIPGMQALPKIPAVQEQVNTNTLYQGWSGHQHQPVSWDNAPAQMNHSQDRWQNDRPRSRSPHRGGFQGQPRSHDQSKPQWNNYADNNRNNKPFGTNRSPPRNEDRFEPHEGFERNAQLGSMFSMTTTYVNNMQQQAMLEPTVQRPPVLEKTVFRPERLSRPEPYGGNTFPGSKTKPPNSRFHEQRAPRFDKPRNQKNQFTKGQQCHPRLEHQGKFGPSRFSDGRRDCDWEPPVKKTRPSKPLHSDEPIPKGQTGKGQAASVICKYIIENVQDKRVHIPDFYEEKALKQAIRARLDVILSNEIQGDIKEMVHRYRTRYGRSTDLKLFDLVLIKVKKEQEAAKALMSSEGAESGAPSADDKPAPTPTAPNELPRFPQGERMQFQKKELEGEIEYLMEPSLQTALDTELSAIDDVVRAECIDPQDGADKAICEHVNNFVAKELKKVLGLTLKKQLLNIDTNLLVRIFFCPKMPKRDSLLAFLKKYGVTSINKTDNKNMCVVSVNTYKNFDRLIALGQATMDDMTTVKFKPQRLTGPPKMSKDQTENQTKADKEIPTKSFNKQCENQDIMLDEDQDVMLDEDQDVMLDENQDTMLDENQDTILDENQDTMLDENQDIMLDENQETAEEYHEDVEEEHSESEDTAEELSDAADLEELDLSIVNADDLEDY